MEGSGKGKEGDKVGKMLKAVDVAEILQIGDSKAYQIIRQLNLELEKAGYYTVRGRISRAYFEKRFFGKEDKCQL